MCPWPCLAPIRPGTERKRPATRTAIERLLLAGDWIYTRMPASMESAAYAGRRAADEIARDCGMPSSLALPVRRADGLTRLMQRTGSERSRLD